MSKEELNLEEPDFEAVETSLEDFGTALDDWIAGSSLTRIPVTIYGAGHLHVEVQQLDAEREILEAELESIDDSSNESTVGEVSRVGEIMSRLEEINARNEEVYDEWMASKTVWIVEDISDRLTEIRDAVGDAPKSLDEPELPKRATEAQQRTHTVAMQKYEAALPEYVDAAKAWGDKYAAHYISTAVVRVELANGKVAHSVSPEQVFALAKSLGEKQIEILIKAIKVANEKSPVIDAPLSRSTLPDDQI